MDDRIKYVTVTEAITPKEGFVVYLDRYWVFSKEHHALVFYNPMGFKYYVPQCSREERICCKLADKLYPGTVALFLPLAFVNEAGWYD